MNELDVKRAPVIGYKLQFKHSCKGETFNEIENAIKISADRESFNKDENNYQNKISM